MKQSLFSSSLRAFFLTLFGMLGLAAGLVPLMLVIAAFSTGDSKSVEVKDRYTPRVYPNAEGIRKKLSDDAPVILKVDVHGMIGTEQLNMFTIRDQLTESREGTLKDSRVKAVIVSISSPGGTVVDSDGIYRALLEYKQHFDVPIYVHIDGLCASGGMYIAAAADKVLATDVSIVGSVGVITSPFFNVTEAMGKLGVTSDTISAGKGKDDMNPFRPWKPDEAAGMTHLIDALYTHFVDVVATGRPNLDKEKLRDIYGAQMFPAPEAKEKGFIDAYGVSFQQATELLATEIGITDDYYQVVEMEGKYWFSNLFNSSSPLITGEWKHSINMASPLPARMQHQLLYLCPLP